jgi:cell wall assembly regulator SMI1
MSLPDWGTFLQDLSHRILADEGNLWIDAEYRDRGYLGYPGAGEQEIAAAERRLQCRLPNSFRSFLMASDGWAAMGAASPGKLWSVSELGWLRERQQDLIRAGRVFQMSLEEHLLLQGHDIFYHGPFMESCLEISDWGDACILFLCPEVTTSEGEWECWEWASWHPGAMRYPSFAAWFASQLEHFSRQAID